MSDKDIVEEARDLVIQLGQERKSALCNAVTHKVVEAHAQNLINRLTDEVESLRNALKQIQHRCGCCVTNKECSQAVLDIDKITRKALDNEIHGYKVGK